MYAYVLIGNQVHKVHLQYFDRNVYLTAIVEYLPSKKFHINDVFKDAALKEKFTFDELLDLEVE